ncbi:MAG: hypothetical protein U0414_19225 [Polyangiaceae bacterium]
MVPLPSPPSTPPVRLLPLALGVALLALAAACSASSCATRRGAVESPPSGTKLLPQPSTQASTPAPDCPVTEPGNHADCRLPIGASCLYSVPASRSAHCHCMSGAWECGTPLGIDVDAPAGTCPAVQPKAGATCSLVERDPQQNRPGCFYDVPMAITHDCNCAHYGDADRGEWDCGQLTGDAPVDARGCPARQPPGESLCKVPPTVDCQYGYNLSTNCRCGEQGGVSTWTCVTTPQPPSPGR